MEWAKVYKAQNEMEANLIKGFLENEEIKVVIQPDTTAFYSQYRNYSMAPWSVCVLLDFEQKAKKLLADK
jgi:hypothetical protein